MSFKNFINETNDIMNLMNTVTDIQNKFMDSYKVLQSVKQLSDPNDKASKLLGNINLLNQIDKIDIEMQRIGKLLADFQNSINGGRTVASTTAGWEGPD
jgi:hypothetical protein